MNAMISTDGEFLDSHVLIVPQFLIHDDFCWDKSGNRVQINSGDFRTWCGFPIWSSEGWKDGHMSLGPSSHVPMYSYAVFNSLIEKLADSITFPNLKEITFFGFSAGAQVLQRFAALPHYEIDESRLTVRFVLSDPSSYMYLDNRRPQPSTFVIDYDPLTWSPSNGVAAPGTEYYHDDDDDKYHGRRYPFSVPDVSWNRWQVCPPTAL